MKIQTIIGSVVAGTLLVGCASERWEKKDHCCQAAKCEKGESHEKWGKGEEGKRHENEANLLAKAKISRDDAAKAALTKVPNGTIKEGELEKEHGKLIWSFDITTPDSKDITEVNVDAITGRVLGMEWESPEDQAKENEADEKAKK